MSDAYSSTSGRRYVAATRHWGFLAGLGIPAIIALCTASPQVTRGDDLPLMKVALICVALLILAGFIPGWLRLTRAASPLISGVIIAGIGLAGVLCLALGGLPWLGWLPGASILASFLGEMARKDGRANLVTNASYTFLGCVLAISSAAWAGLAPLSPLLLTILAPMLLCAVLGRFVASEYAGKLPALVTFLSIFGLALVAAAIYGLFAFFVAGSNVTWALVGDLAPYLPAPILAFSLVATMLDTGFGRISSARNEVAFALIPYCAVGVIVYAMSLLAL